MIVLKSNPGTYYSAQGDLIYVVYEATKATDPVTYPDYKYIADVYISGVLQVRLKRVPQPDSKFGIFNIGDIVRNYLLVNFNPTALTVQAQELGLGEFSIDVQVKFGEEYDGTLYTNVLVDSTRDFYNHYNGRMFGVNTILSDVLDKAATSRSYQSGVGRDSNSSFIPYLPSTDDPFDVVITRYGSVTSAITITVTPTDANVLQILNVSPGAINADTTNFINDGVNYYTVKIGDDSLYQYDLVCEPRYEKYNIHFLNKYGGFDTKLFSKVSRKTINIVKQGYGRLPYTIDSNGVPQYYTNKVYNEVSPTYASQYTEQMTLNSDFINDDEYTWLEELFVSPLVYIELNGYYIPCDITERSYEIKKEINDKLTNITITVSFGNTYSAQQR